MLRPMALDQSARPRASARRVVFSLATLVFSALLSLIALEGLLRLVRDPSLFYPYHRNALEVFHPSEAITPGVSGVSYFTTNGFGTRGPEPDGERVRILTVGGSTTACSVLDDSEAWPALLMRYLDEDANDPHAYWVTNSAIDGHNSQHNLMHAIYLLPEIPELDYLVLYTGLNDLGAWLYSEKFDPAYLEDESHWEGRLGESFRVSRYTPAHWPWFKHLELWKRASVLKSRLESLLVARQRERGRIEEDAELRWMVEQRELRAAVRKMQVRHAKLETLPLALEAYAAMLRRIAATSRQAGVEPVFVAQAMQSHFADEAERGKLWMGAMDGGHAYVTPEEMVQLLARWNATMREVASAERIAFIDLPSLLPSGPELYFDGVHFNERGARAAARAIATEFELRVHPAAQQRASGMR